MLAADCWSNVGGIGALLLVGTICLGVGASGRDREQAARVARIRHAYAPRPFRGRSEAAIVRQSVATAGSPRSSVP